MGSHVEVAIRKVLYNNDKITEFQSGRFYVWLQWVGCSAVIDVYYLDENKQYQQLLCQWNSIQHTIYLNSISLHPNHRPRIITILTTFQRLGYRIDTVCLRDDTEKITNITHRFLRYLSYAS